MNTVLITGADRGLGFALCRSFLELKWTVFAGRFLTEWTQLDDLKKEFPNTLYTVFLDVSDTASVTAAFGEVSAAVPVLDMIVNNAGILTDDGDIMEGLDLSRGLSAFNTNSLGPLRMVENFLPLMDKGLQRLCFVSSEAGSISVCMRDRGPVTYCMSKTALNMAVRILHNRLAGLGYTFRLYHPGWLRTYMWGEKNMEAHLEAEESAAAAVSYFTGHLDSEERLQVVDNEGAVWPF